MSELVNQTFQRIAEMERAGISRQTAFARVAETEGVTPGAISARYYTAAKTQQSTPARARTSKASSAGRQNGAGTIDELDVGRILEALALTLNDLVGKIAELERDAAKWREFRELAAR